MNWKRGSIAAGVGVLMLGATQTVALAQEYEGPTVLSRGGGGGVRPRGERIGEDPKFRVFGSITALWDTGFLPVSVNSAGALVGTSGQLALEGALGIYGTRRWRRSSIGLDYNGSYRDYTKNQYYNGSDNYLGLQYGNQVDKRTLVTGSVTAGTSSRVFSALGSLVGTQVGNILPTTDIFDARTYFLYGGMGLSRQESTRFGFELRADAFRVERHSTSLISVQGYTAKASASYRLNLRQRLGTTYEFTHFDYPRAFGEADVHSGTMYYSYQLSKLWRVQADFGAYLAATAGSRTVAVDPVVFALLGIPSITEAFARTVILPTGKLLIEGTTKNSTFRLNAYRGVGAGNGVSLTTSETSASASYSYVWSRMLTSTIGAGFTKAASLSNSTGNYDTYSTNGTLEYHTRRRLVYSLNGIYRRTSVTSFNVFGRNIYQIGLGLGWNPDYVPFFH